MKHPASKILLCRGYAGAVLLLVGGLFFGLPIAPRLAPAPAYGLGVQLTAGDIVVLEQGDVEHQVPAALIRVDPDSGEQTVITSGWLLAEGSPNGFVFNPYTGHFLVVDRAGRLIEIDPTTGAQTLVAQVFGDPTGIAVEAPGYLLITEYDGSLLRFDVASRTTSVLASGGLIGEVAPWAVEVGPDGSIFVSGLVSGGYDVPGPPSRVIRIDALSGAQSLVAEITDGHFRDFALTSTDAIIAISSRGYPSGQDTVARLDLATGQLTPILTGLQRVLDVDFAADGSLVVLDQLLSLPCCPPWVPVVYRASEEGGSPSILAQGGSMFAPGRLVVVPPTLSDASTPTATPIATRTATPTATSAPSGDGGGGGGSCAVTPNDHAAAVWWLLLPIFLFLRRMRRPEGR
jgi:hypothetical protein